MNVQCHACIGGTNVGEDIRKLDYGQHVVAGTPGRVFGKVWEAACLHIHTSVEPWDHPTNVMHLDLKQHRNYIYHGTINGYSDEEQQSVNLLQWQLEEMREKTLGKELGFSVHTLLFINKVVLYIVAQQTIFLMVVVLQSWDYLSVVVEIGAGCG